MDQTTKDLLWLAFELTAIGLAVGANWYIRKTRSGGRIMASRFQFPKIDWWAALDWWDNHIIGVRDPAAHPQQAKEDTQTVSLQPTARTFRPAPVADEEEDQTPVALRTWLDYVNAQPDKVPHLAIIGPSGAGKTTLATSVLQDRDGQIVVITAKEGDRWGGLPYVGIDDDATYTAAVRTFDELYIEVKDRLVATKHNRMTADWLTIVVDDFSTLVSEAPVASRVVKLVARLGRSLRVRLIMLTDSMLVKAIGLEGEGETRSNFAFIRIRHGHGAIIEIDGAPLSIDTSTLHQIANSANLAPRAWQASHKPGLTDQDDLIEELLDLPEPGRQAGRQAGSLELAQKTPSERCLPAWNGLDGEPLKAAAIRVLLDAGATQGQIKSLLRGDTTMTSKLIREVAVGVEDADLARTA